MMPNMSVIIRRCSLGLLHMHDRGWVHCDVKPDNFLADEQSNVKLIDFSIGQKIVKGWKSWFNFFPKSIRGTRSYIAPEQIRRKKIDQRTDIYGLGCTIFELLGRKVPFTGNSPNELLKKHLTGSIPSLEACSDVTPEFAAIVRKMMAKNPNDRYQNLAQFLDVFEKTSMFKPGKRPEGFVK